MKICAAKIKTNVKLIKTNVKLAVGHCNFAVVAYTLSEIECNDYSFCVKVQD